MTKINVHVRAVVLAIGMFLLLASPARAVVITDVSVLIGTTQFTAASVGWTFPYTLQPGQDLVLTQSLNGPATTTTSYNFDTSDIFGNFFPIISITADGVTTQFTDLAQILNTKGIDIPNNVNNEAQVYGIPLVGPGYTVFLGYADNTHTGPCGGWASSVGLNGSLTCLPSPFFGATYFDGAGGLNPPQLVQTDPNHCDGSGTIANCYEGGVIRILATQNVPEPGVMALLLTGAAIAAARYGRRLRRRA
jgi:hypothetical protein